jgi:hypothetical protein
MFNIFSDSLLVRNSGIYPKFTPKSRILLVQAGYVLHLILQKLPPAEP